MGLSLGQCYGVRGPDPPCAHTGDELEQIRPSVYRNVARQLHISLQSEPVVTDAFLAVAGHIFSAGRSGPFPQGTSGRGLNICGSGRLTGIENSWGLLTQLCGFQATAIIQASWHFGLF